MATRRFALINSPVEEEQIVDGSTYARLADNETVTGDWTFSGDVTLSNNSLLRLDNTTDVSPTSTDHPFQIGPSDSFNIAVDVNEIMARNNGAVSTLFLNVEGGLVDIGSGGLDVAGAVTASSYGGITEANLLDKTGTETISGSWTLSSNLTVNNGSSRVRFDVAGDGQNQLYLDTFDGNNQVVRWRNSGSGASPIEWVWSSFDAVADSIWLKPKGRILRAGRGSGQDDFTIDASQVLLEDGTETNPALSFAGDTDNGLFLFGGNSPGISAAGLLRFNAHSSGVTFRDGGVYIEERAAAETDASGFGQLWVKNTTPNELWFTNDAGTDIKIA